MIGDGYGYDLNIPVIMIDYKDGEKLKKLAKSG